MKSSSTLFVGVTTFLSLFAKTQAGSLSDVSMCGVPGRTDNSKYFSVVGVQGTGVQMRQELRELEKDTETWNLFIQAFARFQAMDQSDKVSYFEVAGM
jgi:tyrosinase